MFGWPFLLRIYLLHGAFSPREFFCFHATYANYTESLKLLEEILYYFLIICKGKD